jgi:hypothetical protein
VGSQSTTRLVVIACSIMTARDVAAEPTEPAPITVAQRSPPPRPPTLMPRTAQAPILIGPEEPSPDPTRSPSFVLIDRFNSVSMAGAELTVLDLDGPDRSRVFRGQIAGRYVDATRHVGGYLELPYSFLTGSEDTRAIGNAEIGGLLVRPNAGGPTHAFVFHAGVTLPTGSTGDGAAVNARAALARPADVYLALPGATSFRIGASSVFRNKDVFGRVDLGFDLNVDVRRTDNRADPVLTLNLGFGVLLGRAALLGEVSNAYVVNDSGLSHEDKLINVAAISLRVDAGRVFPYLSFLVPFDGDSSEVLDSALTIGLEAKL